MKKYRHTATALLLTLLVALHLTAASAEAFPFPSGVGWESTPAQMLAAEGVRDLDANVHQRAVYGFTQYYIDRDAHSNSPFYVYHEETPVLLYLQLPRDTRAVNVYAEKAEALTAAYGKAIGYTPEDIYKLLAIIWQARIAAEDFERATCWRLADGTLAALLTVRGENYIMYINEDLLRSFAN